MNQTISIMNYQPNIYCKHHRAIAKPPQRIITFIDTEVIKNSNFIATLNSETEIIIIDPNKDGIEQITKILANCSNIKSLQIIASVNGNEDSLKIGSTQLNIHNLDVYANELKGWRNALLIASEILVFGCLVVAESVFQNFIYQLAKITGADIGAFVLFPDSLAANNQESDRYSLMVAWRS